MTDLNLSDLFYSGSLDPYTLKDAIVDRSVRAINLLESKGIILTKGDYRISMDIEIMDGGILILLQRNRRLMLSKIIERRVVKGEWHVPVSLFATVRSAQLFKLYICSYRERSKRATCFRVHSIKISRLSWSATPVPVRTYLPNWKFWQKFIHRVCRRSKLVNSFVAAVEMRLGREELLSLPQYMGLCPTGACNASCLFCSVTHNRKGIQKHGLPYDKLEHFLAPVSKTIRMFGLEGNGEPTLYKRFEDLVGSLTYDGAGFYLITNGERLNPEIIDFLIASGITSVNFSLNAATADTHFRVMRLKGFEHIIDNIKMFSDFREVNGAPDLSVSFVVNSLNIHEVIDFLDLGLKLLKNSNDRIYIRPLSELANDDGSIEDTRNIVPYESDIRDMIEGVRSYLNAHPSAVSVIFDPESFKSYRPDPVDRVVVPKGYETQLLPPRKDGWEIRQDKANIRWRTSGFSVSLDSLSGKQEVMKSVLIPVDPFSVRELQVSVAGVKGDWTVHTFSETGEELSSLFFPGGRDSGWQIMRIETGENEVLYLGFSVSGDGSLAADFTFRRFRAPANRIVNGFNIPDQNRWQIDTPGVAAEWEGRRLSLEWSGPLNLYLVKSYLIPCRPNEVITFPVRVNVGSGQLVIGVLSGNSLSWVEQFHFSEGGDNRNLTFNSGVNRGVYLVVFSGRDGRLKTVINWLPGTQDGVEDRAVGDHDALTGGITERTASSPAQVKRVPSRKKKEKPANLQKHKIKYYCQKPWTDLNNFVVEGRMDVCCIATGSSQERYALGNIYEDDFQSIWNGERMRKFRRTVNSKKKLPPCQRCPMAYAYQGPFFVPKNFGLLNGRNISSIFRYLGLTGVHSKLSVFVDDCIYKIFFKGFKR